MEPQHKLSKRQRYKLAYVDWFLKKHLNLLPLFMTTGFPSKEITETMAAVNALFHNSSFDVDRKDGDIICYVIGDGRTPRTAAVIAQSSNFKVWSIDPLLKIKKRQQAVIDTIPRLHLFPGLAEDFVNVDEYAPLSIIIAVHSHANLEAFWSRIKGPKIAIAIPCCVAQTTDVEELGRYRDEKIFSEKNEIVYWHKT